MTTFNKQKVKQAMLRILGGAGGGGALQPWPDMSAEMAWPSGGLTCVDIKAGIIIITLYAMRPQPFNCCLLTFGIHAACETANERMNLKLLGPEDFNCNISRP